MADGQQGIPISSGFTLSEDDFVDKDFIQSTLAAALGNIPAERRYNGKPIYVLEPANRGLHFMNITKDGFVKADSVAQSNLTAIIPPAVGNDTTEGYDVGSLWLDTVANEYYRCSDATFGAAVWPKTTLTADELATVAVSGDYNDLINKPSSLGWSLDSISTLNYPATGAASFIAVDGITNAIDITGQDTVETYDFITKNVLDTGRLSSGDANFFRGQRNGVDTFKVGIDGFIKSGSTFEHWVNGVKSFEIDSSQYASIPSGYLELRNLIINSTGETIISTTSSFNILTTGNSVRLKAGNGGIYSANPYNFTFRPRLQPDLNGNNIDVYQDILLQTGITTYDGYFQNIDTAGRTSTGEANHIRLQTNGVDTFKVGIDGSATIGSISTDPTAVNGMLYYNSTNHKFRGVQNGAWLDVIGGGDTIIDASNALTDGIITSISMTGDASPSRWDWYLDVDSNASTSRFHNYYARRAGATVGGTGLGGGINFYSESTVNDVYNLHGALKWQNNGIGDNGDFLIENGETSWSIRSAGNNYDSYISRSTGYFLDRATSNGNSIKDANTWSLLNNAGVGGIGLGHATLVKLENAGGASHEASKMVTVWTDATAAAEDADWYLETITAGAMTEKLRVKSSGAINMSSLPTASAGLVAGDIWNNSGVLNII